MHLLDGWQYRIAKLALEPRPNSWPLVVYYREINVVAIASVCIEHVFPKYALFRGTQSEDCSARSCIINIRLEFDPATQQHLKGIPKLQQLGFGIDMRALERSSDPRHTNFKTSMLGRDVMITCRADGSFHR